MQEDFRWFAKYPYDPRASDILKTISLNIEDFEEEDLNFLVKDAVKRINDLLKGDKHLLWDNDYQEMIKFYLSLLILRGTNNEYVFRAYSDAESKRAFKLLVNEDEDKIIELGKAFNIEITRVHNVFLLHYVDFINYTKGLSPIHWKLFNFKLEGGYVKLSKRQVSRVLANIVKRKVYEMIKTIEATPSFLLQYSNEITKIADFYE